MNPWPELLDLCKNISQIQPKPDDRSCWPILGLVKRTANLVRSIAVLSSKGFWSESIGLLRVLFEAQIALQWLNSEDKSDRIEIYAASVEEAKQVLIKKMLAGKSLSSLGLALTVGVDGLDYRASKAGKAWSALSVRERSQEVNAEREYDVMYWYASQYVHASALSVLGFDKEVMSKFPFLGEWFEWNGSFAKWIITFGVPSAAFRAFRTAEAVLPASLRGQVHTVDKLAQQAYYSETGVEARADVPPGVMTVTSNKGDVIEFDARNGTITLKNRNGDVLKSIPFGK